MAGDQGGGFCILCILGDIFDPFSGLAGAGPVYTPPKSQVDVMNHIGGFKIPTGLPRQVNIIGMLGLPSAGGCEFGVCINNVAPNVSWSGPNASGSNSYPGLISDAACLWALTGSHTRVHGLYTYGNYCGSGGSGNPTDSADAACLAHDFCYANNNLSFSDNRNAGLSPSQAALLQGCNQALCTAMMYNTDARFARQHITWFFQQYPRKESACH